MKIIYKISLLTIIILLTSSCSEKPTYDNPFDPNSSFETIPMQGELVIIQLSDSQAKLQWQLNPTIIGNYIIKRKINEGNFEILCTVNKDTNTYVDTELLTSNTYSYQLIGSNGDIQTDPLSASISTIFTDISNFTLVQENIYTAKLNWQHNCSYEEGYIIERCETSFRDNILSKGVNPDQFRSDQRQNVSPARKDRTVKSNKTGITKDTFTSHDFIQIADLQANVFEFIDDSILPNHTYEYKIYSYTAYNETSEQLLQISMNFPYPENLTIEQNDVHTFTLTWSDISLGEQNYILERKIDDDEFIIIVDNIEPGTEIFLDDINLRNTFENVYYRLYANYETEASQISQVSSEIVFFPISNLIYIQLDINTIELNWIDTNLNEDGFIIEKKVDSENWEFLASVTNISYTDDGAEINHNLQYRVQTYCGINYTDFIETETIDNTFPVPSNLEYEQLTIASVKLTWDDNSVGEEGFKIDKKVGISTWQIEYAIVGENIEEWIDTSAEINEDVQYRIYAFSGNNQSDSIETGVINNSIPAPTDLLITQNDVHTFSLVWNDNSEGEEGFTIERKIDEGNYILVGTNTENDTTFVDDINLTRDNYETIYYKIKTFYQTFYSDSLESSYSINFPPPTNLTYGNLTINSIELTWQDNSTGEEGFKIDKKVGIGTWQIEYAIVGENIEEWTDVNAEINEDVQYRIYAFSGNNQSDSIETGVINNSIPAPTDLLITQDDVHTFSLVWNDNSEGEEGFTIERKIDDGSYILVGTNTENDTTFVDDINQTRDNYETIYYKIKTFYQTFYSDSLESSYSINFPPPTNLTYENLTINSIELNWDDNSTGEEGFKIDKKVGINTWQAEYAIVGENIEEWTDLSAEINEDIQYRIYAFSGNNQSDSVETEVIRIIFTSPFNLQYEHLTLVSVQLAWSDSSNIEEGFKIDKKVGINPWQIEYAIVGENIEEWIDTNAEINENLQYRVYTFSGNNQTDSIETGVIDNTIPAPTNLSIDRLSYTDVKLTWQDNSIGETGFKIDRKVGEGQWQIEFVEVNENIDEWIDENVEVWNLNYYYRIYAYFSYYNSNILESNIFISYSFDNYLAVPYDYSTIQTAIDASNDMDIVLIFPNTYFENINFQGKSITVTSLFLLFQETSFIDQTVIDGNQNGHVVTFNNGETLNSTLLGITITNGFASGSGSDDDGGGVYCEGSSPNLTNLIISNNYADDRGGGIGCDLSNPIITNLTLINNNAGNFGGGLYCDNSNPILTNNIFTGNSASWGGGIYCMMYSDAILNNVDITGNSGGGIWLDLFSDAILNNVKIIDNIGSGIYIHTLSFPSLTNIIISGNVATKGAGIFCGSIASSGSGPQFTNVTLVNNSATSVGGGVYCEYNGNAYFENCIFWNNLPQEVFFRSDGDPNFISFSYSDIQGGQAGIITNNNGTVEWLDGNIDLDPLFVNPNYSNFHLQPGSPCINTGNPDLQYNDPDGTRNDMGAYGGPGGDW